LSAGEIEIAKLGATSGIDRFADTTIWSRLPTGEPYFPAARAWIRGRIVAKMDAGSSTVIAVEALEIKNTPVEITSAPLVYHDRTWHGLDAASRIE
jgi:flavin reductase (DIM6/NTAB) family NADH-FMN oxidoreductase RutF